MEYFLLFITGAAMGAWVKDREWVNNARRPMRMKRGSRFYKVYELASSGGVKEDPGGHLS